MVIVHFWFGPTSETPTVHTLAVARLHDCEASAVNTLAIVLLYISGIQHKGPVLPLYYERKRVIRSRST